MPTPAEHALEPLSPKVRAWVYVLGWLGVPVLAMAFFMAKDVGFFEDVNKIEHRAIIETNALSLEIMKTNKAAIERQERQTAALIAVMRAICVNMAKSKEERDGCFKSDFSHATPR